METAATPFAAGRVRGFSSSPALRLFVLEKMAGQRKPGVSDASSQGRENLFHGRVSAGLLFDAPGCEVMVTTVMLMIQDER